MKLLECCAVIKNKIDQLEKENFKKFTFVIQAEDLNNIYTITVNKLRFSYYIQCNNSIRMQMTTALQFVDDLYAFIKDDGPHSLFAELMQHKGRLKGFNSFETEEEAAEFATACVGNYKNKTECDKFRIACALGLHVMGISEKVAVDWAHSLPIPAGYYFTTDNVAWELTDFFHQQGESYPRLDGWDE